MQAHARDSGIIWHTQGSGKSLTMVWLKVKWLREHVTDARASVYHRPRHGFRQADRKGLQGRGGGHLPHQERAGLVQALNSGEEWLICSLVHKFGAGEDLSEREVDDYVAEIRSSLPRDFRAKGAIFVFVDECHRTQSGKLHRAMKALLPEAMFIGFTGTPLLKRDKQTSLEVFGPYIHTYKYDEAVRDGVVLDLRYEARDIDQDLTSPDTVDLWFDVKTKGLSDIAKAQLKQRWGTMQRLHSALNRLEKIRNDILMDMEVRDRLASGHGNALLVSDSIYAACRFYEMFQSTSLAGKCAIVTSYKPGPGQVKGEDAGEGMNEALLKEGVPRRCSPNTSAKSRPCTSRAVRGRRQEALCRACSGQMKLLIVVTAC